MLIDFLQTPIMYLKGVGPKIAEILQQELQIYTFENLLLLIPHRYVDKSKYYKIAELQPSDVEVQLIGKITYLKEIKAKKNRLNAIFEDEEGNYLELNWFSGIKYLKEHIKLREKLVIYGKLSQYNGQFNIAHPEIELYDKHQAISFQGLHPVYPLAEKLNQKYISQKYLRGLIFTLFQNIEKQDLLANLTTEIRKKYQVLPTYEALFKIHFPKDLHELKQAQYSLKFEELFFLQLAFLIRKRMLQLHYKSFPFTKIGTYFNDFYAHLSFPLTQAQKRVLKEIRKDLGREQQMNRLLQGDVGSGKTIVAFLASLIALDNQYQVALIAPTEILAMQHYELFRKKANILNIEIALLTGSTTKKNRTFLHENLQNGNLQILIGTHALFEENVIFHNLGLVIIDEQHRFGVAQRAKMYHKNKLVPHILAMSATPIPRTLAMTFYGDLDISIIDELPAGRKMIKTIHQKETNRLAVFKSIANEIAKGQQIYVVYPIIQESEKLDLNNLMMGYESMQRYFPLPQYAISIVHGKMSAADKQYEMQRFVKGETQIMIATTVIEVGVNVPNASVMLIENAERFGLAQLHQLRGRVGRGAAQSYCILMTKDKLSEEAQTRIRTLCTSNDGFQIATVDLELRGAGNLMGTQQSGALNLQIADLSKDGQIVSIAREAAQKLLTQDPDLQESNHKNIRENFLRLQKDKLSWIRIS